MQKNRLLFIIFFQLCIVSLSYNCSTTQINGNVKNDFKKYNVKTIAILDFEDRNQEIYKKFFPEASKVTTESIESAFVGLGFTIVERNQISKIFKEWKLSQTGITVEESKKIGKLLNADVIILGSVTTYIQGGIPSKTVTKQIEKTSFGFTLKGLDVESGSTLFSGNYFKKFDNILNYVNPINECVNVLIEEMIKDFKSKGLISH
jgi:hypothetical protein